MFNLRNLFTGRSVTDEPTGETPPVAPSGLLPRTPARTDGRIQILAVDDNATNRLVLSALLLPLGAELIMAGDGVQAVTEFREGDFDLVLMDIEMPNMCGVEATRAIRAWERQMARAATPIVAVTGNVLPDEVAAYLAAGVDSVIAKPIDPSKLFAVVQDAAPQRQAA